MQKMKSKGQASPLFPVSDFYLAAFLLCEGMELARTQPAGPRRVTFLLRDIPRREQLIADFYSHRATVDPLVFKNAIMDLKSLIHGLRHAEGRA